MDDVTFSTTISAEHYQALSELADAKAISINELIEQLVDAERE